MTKHFGGPSSDCIDLDHCLTDERRGPDDAAFIKAEIITSP
jgi:hypothetical protein